MGEKEKKIEKQRVSEERKEMIGEKTEKYEGREV